MAYNQIPFTALNKLKTHVVSGFLGIRLYDKVTNVNFFETKTAKANKDNQFVFGKTSRVLLL